MKKIIILLGVMVTCVRLHALPDQAVVKIISQPCGAELSAFVGSGLLFRHQGQTFVLTSEHVVLHSNKDICHEVRNSEIGKKTADLVVADWGMGLALLKLQDPISLMIPELSDLTAHSLPSNTPVTAFGYAYRSDVLTKDNSGRILLPQSPRGLIPFVRHMVEVLGSFVEYGMSGGPVIAQESNSFVGVLSHQALRLVTAGPSDVIELAEGSPLANDFFVIPSEIAVDWVRKNLNSNIQSPAIVRDAKLQLENKKEVLFTQGLQFLATTSNEGGPVGGPEGAGRRRQGPVGGPEGAGRRREGPVGGPEGAGRIGGSETTASDVKVAISLDIEDHQTAWNFPLRQEWFNSVRDSLLRQETLMVPYFIQYDTNQRTARRVFFNSLSEFFTLLQNPDLTPIAQIDHSKLRGVRGREDVFESLNNRTKIFVDVFTKLQNSSSSYPSADANDLTAQLRLLTELLNSGDFDSIEIKWVKNLRSTRYESAWQHFFLRNFDLTVELISQLIQITELLEKGRI